MSNVNLTKLFGLEPSSNYWKHPFDPQAHFATEIYASGLPPVLDKPRIISDFTTRLVEARPQGTLYFIPGEDTERFPTGTSLIFAFSNYVPMNLASLLETSINIEIRRHGLFPNYNIAVESNELYQILTKENKSDQGRPGPDLV